MQANKKTQPFVHWRNRKVLFWCKVKYGTDAKRKFRRFQKMSTINFRHFYLIPCMPCLSAQRSVKYSNKSTFFKTMRFLCLSFQLKYKSSLIHAGILYFFISIISSCHGQFYRRQVVIHFHCFSSYSTHLYLYLLTYREVASKVILGG